MADRGRSPEDVIRLHNAVFYAYHGVLSDEQSLGGKFEVDVDLYCDLSRGAQTDDLRRTVDYQKVYACVRTLVLARKHFLLESVAGTIAKGILKEFRAVRRVTVRVRKPSAPLKGVVDHVEVELSRSRP
jgi:dihydroneopterin aldolase